MLGKNPIRKVVTLLQDMQKEIQVEMDKEKELYEKFMCFCNSNGGELATKAAEAKAAIEEFSSKLKAEEAETVRIAQELIEHKTDRENAKKDLAEATSLRTKEKADYDATSADRKTNIGALGQAIPTLEKAMAGGASFIQLPHSRLIKRIAQENQNIDDWDRKALVAFLEQKQSNGDEGPSSGQIVGVMKQLKDDMEAEDKEADEDEAKNAAGFAELKSSKEKEIEFATEAIETKTVRKGELAVSVVQTKDSLEDTQDELVQTEKMTQQMATECATKDKAFKAQEKSRTEEIAAVGEAIKILNEDEALALFQNTMGNNNAPQQGALDFLQKDHRRASKFQKGQAVLAEAALHFPSTPLKLILFTMNSKLHLQGKGKVQKFTEVIKMVDDMIVILGKEQANDVKHKTFCAEEFEKNADDESATNEKIAQLDASISQTTDELETLAEEIGTLGQSIKDLDKAVATATEQRKEEHAAYVEAQTMNEAAIALLQKAKARLEKVYKPSFAQTDSFLQIRMRTRMHTKAEDEDDAEDDQEPKKSDKGGGVLGLMDMMIHELESGGKDAEFEEKTAQKDYSKLMSDSQASRAQDIKSLTDKEGAKAEKEVKLEGLKGKAATAATELMNVKEAASNLHADCDFIVQNFDLRKEARTNEIESLKNAKAILSGADFR